MVDAYALIGDVSGLAEKIQSFFMQEVLSQTHSAVKSAAQEVIIVRVGFFYSFFLDIGDVCWSLSE